VTVLDNQLDINFYTLFCPLFTKCIVAAILNFHNLAGKLLNDVQSAVQGTAMNLLKTVGLDDLDFMTRGASSMLLGAIGCG